MCKKVFWSIGVLLLVISFSGTAMAVFTQVGPTRIAGPGTGFPAFYVDSNGVAAQLCLDFVTGNCLSVPPIALNPTSVQAGFGEEGFYWGADVIDMPLGDGGTINIIMALEAAWATINPVGVPAPGQQVVFGRLRIRARTGTNNGTNLPATFTVTHPFGVETFDAVPANVLNQNAINFTNDNNGVIVPQVFTDALNSPVGPFLVAVNPAPPAGFFGNPNVLATVTGSPLGTNFFAAAINGTEVARTTQFNVHGQSAGLRMAAAELGIFRGGSWFKDTLGNGAWDGCTVALTDTCNGPFGGVPFDTPIAGVWTAGGPASIGIYRGGMWFLDANDSGFWEGALGVPPDVTRGPFGGVPGDIPVVGDWTGDGLDKIGIYRGGTWFLDLNNNGLWDGTPTDAVRGPFGGLPGDIPVVGNWDGALTGQSKIGIYRNGFWFLDQNNDGTWSGQGLGLDTVKGPFGALAGDIPVTGIWSNTLGDVTTKIGIYRGGAWFLDLDNNGLWGGNVVDIAVDSFGGLPGDAPVTGRW